MMVLTFILAAAAVSTPRENMVCRKMVVARQSGDLVRRADTEPATCGDSALRGLRYDVRRMELRAVQDLAPGDSIGRVWFPQEPVVSIGDRVIVTAQMGHVRLSRAATALQRANQGQSYFVQADDGTIFVAPPAGGQP
jgi:Flagellar basal body P-ring biosynthesis protein